MDQTTGRFPRVLLAAFQWLDGPGHDQLADSLIHFMGAYGDELTELRTDTTRFTSLLGHDDGGGQRFGTR